MAAAAPLIHVTEGSNEKKEQRKDRVDGEPEVVHPDSAVEVPEAAEADDQHARDDQEAQDHPEQVKTVSGRSGSIPIPLKMSGNAISMIDESIVAMRTPSVVFDRAIHV